MWSCTTFPVSFVALWEDSLPTLVCGNVGKCVKCTTCLSHKPGTPFLESNIHKTECTYLNDNEAYLPCRQKQRCEVCIFHQASDELFHSYIYILIRLMCKEWGFCKICQSERLLPTKWIALFLLPLGDAHNCSLTCIRMCKIDYHLEAIYNFHHLATFHSVIVGAMLCKSQLYTWNWVFTALVPPSLYKQTCLLSEILDLHLWTHRENKYYEEYKVWLFVCVRVICV